jgi:hypothetical protein
LVLNLPLGFTEFLLVLQMLLSFKLSLLSLLFEQNLDLFTVLFPDLGIFFLDVLDKVLQLVHFPFSEIGLFSHTLYGIFELGIV